MGMGNLVAVYPLEGTFMATHPACINKTADAEINEAAQLFRDFLLDEASQLTALATGLRPVNTAVPVGPPLEPANGVNPEQPEIVFDATFS